MNEAPKLMSFMKSILLLSLSLLIASPVFARVNESERRIGILRHFSRAVDVHRCSQDSIPCFHTTDVAQAHAELYRTWQKTGQWPPIAYRLADDSWDKPKQNAKTVIRISRYLHEDSSREIELDNNGRIAGFGARYDMVPWEGKSRYLNARQFNNAVRQLSKLPPSQPVLTVPNILVISGRVHGRWITRVYSRSRLPKQAQDLTHWLDKRLHDKFLLH